MLCSPSSHVSVFILPVGLSVIANDPIGIGCGTALSVRTGNLSVDVVEQTLEKTFTQVHVTDGVNWLSEVYTAGQLAVTVAPMVLDALQMPLVYDDNDTSAFALVDLLEQVFIAFVNENLLQPWEEYIRALNVPVDQMLIETLLRECLRASLCNLMSVRYHLIRPLRHVVHVPSPQVVRHKHACLVHQSLVSYSIHLGAHEFNLCTHFISCFTSILDLDSWEPESEFMSKSEMESESSGIHGPTG